MEVIDKVRALLNQAESTNFGPEAEAFVAKAHALMAKHSIDEAVLHAADDKAEDIIVLRLRGSRDGKAQLGRAGLLNAIAKTSRCKLVLSGDEFMVIGFKSDCEYVEIMYHSLVVQMLGALYDSRDEDSVTGKALDYDQSFCDAFASRIYMRLEKVVTDVEKEVAPTGSSTALVLVKRSEKVQAKVQEMFPDLSPMRGGRKYNANAAAKGDAAGKNADIGNKKVGGGKKAIG